MRHDRHLERALHVASVSTQAQKHGAVIARNGRVLSVGTNAARNRPGACTDPETQAGTHAEIAAIRALPPGTDFSRLTLYSARLGKLGDTRYAKPCRNCQKTILRLGFKEVFWT